jgi:hypothetical protein
MVARPSETPTPITEVFEVVFVGFDDSVLMVVVLVTLKFKRVVGNVKLSSPFWQHRAPFASSQHHEAGSVLLHYNKGTLLFWRSESTWALC